MEVFPLFLKFFPDFQYEWKTYGNYVFPNNKVVLTITIDNKPTFKAHIKIFCEKASYQSYALQRMRKLLAVMEAKI